MARGASADSGGVARGFLTQISTAASLGRPQRTGAARICPSVQDPRSEPVSDAGEPAVAALSSILTEVPGDEEEEGVAEEVVHAKGPRT